MKGAEDIKHQSQEQFNMIMVLSFLAMAFLFVLFSPLIPPPASPALGHILIKIQYAAAKLYLNYYIKTYQLLEPLFMVVGFAPWFLNVWKPQLCRTPRARKVAIFAAITTAAICLVLFFLLTRYPPYNDDQQRYYWALRFWCEVFALLGVAGSPIAAMIRPRGPKSVKELSRNADAFDLEDLSGAAPLEEIASALLPGTSETWPTNVPKDRLVLGRYYTPKKERTNRWLAPFVNDLQQTLVVAPPGSGKTYSIALPWTRELPHKGQSVFVIDLKGNMLHKLYPEWTVEKEAERRKANHSPIYYFDPSNPSESLHWNPLAELDRSDSVAFGNGRDAIAEAIFGELATGDNHFFDLRDLRIIKAGIEAVFHLGIKNPTLADVHVLFLSEDELKQKQEHLSAFPELIDIASTLALPLNSKKNSFEEILQGVNNKLQPFVHPALKAVLSESIDHTGKPFSLSQLNSAERQVFICSTPLTLGLLGSTAASLMVRSLQQVLLRRFKNPPKDRLFMILDEFSKLRLDHKQVENFISTSREAGAVSVIFLQDVSQIREEIRAAVLANCQDRYFLHGAGPQTADWCSKALGQRRRLNTSMSENESSSTKSSSTGLSTSVTESWVPVLRSREIANTGGLRYGAWIVLNRYSHKPMLVNMERGAS